MKTYYTKVVPVQAAEIKEVSKPVAGLAYYDIAFETGGVQLSHAECGSHAPSPGDYVIFGENNDTYLCPRDVFLKKYQTEVA